MFPFFPLAGSAIVLAFLSSKLIQWRSPSVFLKLLDPFWMAMSCILIIFAGTRDGIGSDYTIYTQIYERINVEDWGNVLANAEQEVGFTVLSLLIKGLGATPSQFMLILSLLTISFVLLAIHFSEVNVGVAISVYLLFAHYLSPMNIARQGLACAILFLAVVIFDRSKVARVLSIILGIAAVSIHTAVVIAIVAFLLLRIFKLTYRSLVFVTIACWIFGFILARVPFILNFIGGLNERYAEYALTSTGASGFGSYLVAGLNLIIGFYLLSQKEWTSTEKWYLNIYLLTGPFYLVGTGIDWAARIGEFSSIFLILLLPRLFEEKGASRLVGFLILITGVGYFVMQLKFWGGLIPYDSWLF